MNAGGKGGFAGEDRQGEGSGGAAVRVSRAAYVCCAWIFLFCVMVQVFLAGLATFGDPINWIRHMSFVHLFELLPIVMLILAFVGEMPRVLRWLPVGLFVLIIIQYVTVHLGGAMVAALHPVNALVIFIGASAAAGRSWRYGSSRE